MNQPNAGYANFAVLVESLLPIIDVNGGDVDAVRDAMLAKGRSVFADAVGMAIRSKMGLVGGSPEWMPNVWWMNSGRRSSPCSEWRAAIGRCFGDN